ncbi:MAG: phenylacetate--CoA ligase family protein [Ruminococcaceae bacterium]|nr:phenylacetate--CoA ligase family protein [Oscillospiraceae bacterium]
MSVINKILKSYTKIPLWATNLLAPVYYMIPENKRYGSVYNREMAKLKRIEELSAEEAKKEKDEALEQLVAYAYEHVPYYHELFDSIGLSPTEIKEEKDLVKIPFLTKEILINNREKFLSDEFDKEDLVYLTTSGSTGTPTGFYVQKESPMRERVYCNCMFKDFGLKPDSSRLVMRGKEFWAQKSKGKNWQWDGFKRELSINIFDMTPDNMEEYCKAIEKYKPDFAYGYMSAMYTLCKYIASRNKKLKHQFKGYMAISETVTNEQRRFVESVINARVFSFYGMSERVIIASECKDSTEYHVQPMYGIVEIIDEDDNVITQPGVSGEIAGTGLLNYAMPLIRYKMGDISSWSEKETCKCGSYKKRLTSVQGRKTKDVLIGKDNDVISLASLEVHSEIYDYMARYQFVQEHKGKVTVKAVAVNGNSLTKEKLQKISEVFTKRTNGKIVFTAEETDKIAPKKNGKLSIIDQRLDVSEYL